MDQDHSSNRMTYFQLTLIFHFIRVAQIWNQKTLKENDLQESENLAGILLQYNLRSYLTRKEVRQNVRQLMHPTVYYLERKFLYISLKNSVTLGLRDSEILAFFFLAYSFMNRF